MFRSYDHHQVEKYIATLGLLNWQRIRCFIRSYIIVIVYILLCIVWYSVVMLRCYVYISNISSYDINVALKDYKNKWKLNKIKKINFIKMIKRLERLKKYC
jgi:hypothetical protein